MEEPAESTATRNNFNVCDPSKPVVENTEPENEDRKPPKKPQFSCEYLLLPPMQGFGFTAH
jgi:hypothetical protein